MVWELSLLFKLGNFTKFEKDRYRYSIIAALLQHYDPKECVGTVSFLPKIINDTPPYNFYLYKLAFCQRFDDFFFYARLSYKL